MVFFSLHIYNFIALQSFVALHVADFLEVIAQV